MTLLLRFHDPQTEIQRAIPEARTKAQAERAETKIKSMVYERKYGKVSASIPFAEFVHSVYLPWAKANKRSCGDDERHAKVYCRHFGNKSLSEIDYQMIQEFQSRTDEVNHSPRQSAKTGIGEPGTCDSIWHFQDGG
jgi:hypothetical protein